MVDNTYLFKSVVALSNVNGTIVEAYSYSAFGDTTIHTGAGTDGNWFTADDVIANPAVSAYDNPYMFTGRRFDPETSLYYYRARIYSPAIGRFLQPDPIGYTDSMNLYIYVGNNPINFLDPMGLCKDDVWKQQRCEQLLAYIASAEQAIIANIASLNVLHSKIKRLHRYYKEVLITDTVFSAATAPVTVHKFFAAKSMGEAAKLATKAPFPDAVNTSAKLSVKSIKTLKSAKLGAKLDAAKLAIGFLSIFQVDNARQRAIRKYDVMVNEVTKNIESLSNSVSSAYIELRNLDHD